MKSSRLDELAQEIRAGQNETLARRSLDADANDAVKERLRIARSSKPMPSANWRAFALAAALVFAVFGAAFFWPKGQAAIAFRIGDAPGTIGGFVRAADAPTTLSFSDASTIELAPNARARVVAVDADGARVVLESGSMHATITHRASSKWHVIAGPFDVVVTGTEFDVAWDPTTEHFSVDMKHGTVHVLGTLLGDGHELSTGQHLDVDIPDGVVHEGLARTGATVRTTADMPQTEGDSQSDDAGVVAELPASPSAANEHRSFLPSAVVPSPAPAWASLAEHGDYAKAVATAEVGGFGSALDQGSSTDVLALGDAARFSGHTDEAKDAYRAVRRRAPGEPIAAEAAFDLGKLAFDREHDYAAAVTWFSTYQAESPNGPLALEVAGRLIEAKQKSGDRAGAKEAAEKYLDRWPGGPRASLARSLLGP